MSTEMNELVAQIKKQTAILFENIEFTLAALDEKQFKNAGSWGWPIGEQIFHLLHSLDQWFINPNEYQEPDFIKYPSDSSNSKDVNYINKNEIHFYFKSIKEKVNHYLGELNDGSLPEKPNQCNFTRLELILGQYRHLMYHIGLIHGCIRAETGKTSEYIGLGPPIPGQQYQ